MDITPISVIIVEEEPEFRRRYAQIIGSDPSIVLIGVASTAKEARQLVEREEFDVMLIDIGLADGAGVELIRFVHQRMPDSDILVNSLLADNQTVLAAIEAGAAGYIMKDAPAAELINNIKMLRAGSSPISPVVARTVLRALRERPAVAPQTASTPPRRSALSSREIQILQVLAKGMSFVEIGNVLRISPHTVTAHIKKIYRKLSVHSRGEAVYEAAQMGILQEQQ
jgi:DNA-binding NarL/FixJ family response regulator